MELANHTLMTARGELDYVNAANYNPLCLFSHQQLKNKTEWSIARALKWSIFIVQKLALHKNGVEFRQQSNGDICTSHATPYDDVRRRAT